MAKLTMKEKVLQFVESQGSARFSEIQRFIVDSKFGEGAYDNTKDWSGKKRYRGYYACALARGGRNYWGPQSTGYFLLGKDCLMKTADGSYVTVRG